MNQNMVKIQGLLLYLEYFNVTCTSFSTSVTTKLRLNQSYTNRLRNGRTLRLTSLKASVDDDALMIEMEKIVSRLRNENVNSIEINKQVTQCPIRVHFQAFDISTIIL